MITVSELDRIARARLEDAKALFAAGRFDGATYLCGYAVEVALKARICRILNWPEFPSTGGEFHAYKSFQTHDAEPLRALERGGCVEGRFAVRGTISLVPPKKPLPRV